MFKFKSTIKTTKWITKPEAKPEEPMPQPGDLWKFRTDDPFPPKHTARIIETKDGWVRYEIGVLNDERKSVKSFVSMYQLHQKKL